jgi:hypothetical protein
MNDSRISVSKKIVYSVAVTVSLSLIILGMGVPNISRLHSAKPRPRAVIETAVKTGQEAGTRASVSMEACQNGFTLDIPTAYRSFTKRANLSYNHGPLEQRVARAPPAIPA